MILAFTMYAHDGDAFFFEDRTSSIFCPACGSLLEKNFLPRNVKPRKKWDICSTYDNRKLVSERFKIWCETQLFEGVGFRQVCSQPPYYAFEPSIVLKINPRCARFENKCAACGNYESVV
ncbi:MAG: hypothetical protein L0Z55_07490, partial [Planctomycetes bacterium]|nr:hypothetical protein [Planctomycetota bacterium]